MCASWSPSQLKASASFLRHEVSQRVKNLDEHHVGSIDLGIVLSLEFDDLIEEIPGEATYCKISLKMVLYVVCIFVLNHHLYQPEEIFVVKLNQLRQIWHA